MGLMKVDSIEKRVSDGGTPHMTFNYGGRGLSQDNQRVPDP